MFGISPFPSSRTVSFSFGSFSLVGLSRFLLSQSILLLVYSVSFCLTFSLVLLSRYFASSLNFVYFCFTFSRSFISFSFLLHVLTSFLSRFLLPHIIKDPIGSLHIISHFFISFSFPWRSTSFFYLLFFCLSFSQLIYLVFFFFFFLSLFLLSCFFVSRYGWVSLAQSR